MFILIYPSCIPFSGSPSSIYELAVCGRIHRYMIFCVALMPLHSVSYRDILGSLTFPCFFFISMLKYSDVSKILILLYTVCNESS